MESPKRSVVEPVLVAAQGMESVQSWAELDDPVSAARLTLNCKILQGHLTAEQAQSIIPPPPCWNRYLGGSPLRKISDVLKVT